MTTQPFTLVVGTACDTHILEEFRRCIRCCPHGMLVTTSSAPGTVVVLQPCTHQRVASETPRWIGPITSRADAVRVRAWVQAGDWDTALLPRRLRPRRPPTPAHPRCTPG